MALSITDRDPNYMRKMWGTNKLITDYDGSSKNLQEVMYDPANKVKQSQDLFEDNDMNDFEYGIEPTYKLKKGQQVL